LLLITKESIIQFFINKLNKNNEKTYSIIFNGNFINEL
jgi:hypothetical protein